ncbi:MAG: microcin ABC transporter ATP-binding protein [Rhodobacterales bacterium]|nr:MAG: microcin ABC transporter ATP-binding protein [Rhodobacterales bacterium]
MIETRNLSMTIHGIPVLHDVDLTIAPGKITGLVGESGSGKSMTALAIMGLAPRGAKISGEVLLDGEDLTQRSEKEYCDLRGNRIGMIFQEPMTALNPVQPIGKQVAETLLVHGKAGRAEAMEIAAQKLARVGLPPEKVPLSRYPHELSGGQRQRVAIAMAIALHPELLIADEPTTALDVTTQAQILDLLRELVAEEGMSLLLITHDLAVVAQMADHVAVMQRGEIVEQAPTETLFCNMQHPYTRALLEASGHQPAGVDAPQKAPLLSVENAVREYRTARPTPFSPPGRFRAVNQVSFEIGSGESVGLVGESGCGKSTLTRALLGLEAVQSGRIRFRGEEMRPGVDPAVRAGIQVVFQDPYGSFNPRWQVGKLVSEPFHLLAQRPADWRDRVAQALEEVGISPDAINRYPHEFSGGQRQRIAIARALILRPDLIILDEAVSALDVSIRAQILDLLADLRARHHMAYLFISHDLSVVRRVTDRVLVMRAGEIVERGETEAVFTNPTHEYTQSLIEATPEIPADWRKDARPVV